MEDKTTMELLSAFGCDAAQGYYFSRPVAADDLVRWLETSPFGMTSPQARRAA